MANDFENDCLLCAKQVNDWAFHVLRAQEVASTDSRRVFEIALAVRSLVYCQGIVALIERGLVEPSGALLRVLVEQAFVLLAVRKDATLMQELAEQDLAEKRKALSGLEKLPDEDRPDWMTAQSIDELRNSLPASAAGGFNAYYWADKAGLLGVYNTLYRRLNTFSHGAIGALAAYVSQGPDGEATGIKGNAVPEYGPQFLINGASMVLNIVNGLSNESGASAEFAMRLEALQSRFDNLHGDFFGVEASSPTAAV